MLPRHSLLKGESHVFPLSLPHSIVFTSSPDICHCNHDTMRESSKVGKEGSNPLVDGELTRVFHELLSRGHEDGRATGQLVPRYRGIGSEAYLNGTSQGPTPEDARKDGHIRGRSELFMKYPG